MCLKTSSVLGDTYTTQKPEEDPKVVVPDQLDLDELVLEDDKYLFPKYYFATQSGIENVSKQNKSLKTQTLRFSDPIEDFAHDYTATMDSTRAVFDMGDDSLTEFFSRPIKIYESDWSTTTTFADNFNPWKLFFENPRVVNRTANFYLMRCTLNVKFVINGNSFHYGRILASYLPLAIYDTLSTFAALIPEDAVQESQCPHVFLDPTTSTGGTLKLPFFHHQNNLSIPDSDWDDMGTVFLRSLNALQHANGATDVATISVFAWAEDVQLSIPTTQESDALVPQSGVEKKSSMKGKKENEVDEANRTGVISGPASTVASIATALTAVPAISPYAKATAMGSTALANIAKQFGYCAPTVTKPPEAVKNTAASHMALTNVPQQLQKLSIDEKQELTIDPRISGIGPEDPLNIRNIACRESWLTTFNWNFGTAPETMLFNMAITPMIWAESGSTAYHFPACAMATMPFEYWTGSMKYRFQIVCSNYHKGRLKFVYDPRGNPNTEYNINYMEIVDIADKNDFTLTIGMAQPTTYVLNSSTPVQGTVSSDLYGVSPLTILPPFSNGILAVYVVNELTTPNSTISNDIQINVFVSAGDDFEVAVPSIYPNSFVFKPQSGVEMSVDNMQMDAPEQIGSTDVGTGVTNTDNNTDLVFMGERIDSFRSLLKRFNLHSAMSNVSTQNSWILTGRRCAFPYLRGNVTGAVDQTGAAAPYNYCNTVLLHWVTFAFSGWRGSIRWKVMPRGRITDNNYEMFVQRYMTFSGIKHFDISFVNPSYGSTDAVAHSAVYNPTFGLQTTSPPTGLPGVSYSTNMVNPTIEFEVPFYSHYRFVPGKQQDYTLNQPYTPGWDYCAATRIDNRCAFDTYVSAGEDFQVYFFTGLPRMYLELSPPAP